jgi:hypothetical protein
MRGVVKRILFLAFAAFLLVGFAGFAGAELSSSAAQEKAGAVLGEDAKDANSLAQPFEVGSDSYWVFFFSIYSPKKMLVAVSNSKNEVVTDRDRLSRVGAAVYDYAVTEEFLKSRGWGFDAVEPVLASSAGVVSDQQRRLADFSAQTQGLYPKLGSSFSKIDGALARLSDQVLVAEGAARDGSALETAFASDYSSSSLNSVFKQYNASLRALEALFAAHDAYVKQINEFSFALYSANVTASDATSINQNLDALREDGLKDLRDKFLTQKPQLEFSRLVAARERWVNDSIESTLYRINRRAALDAVSALDSQVNSLLKNEANVVACGVPRDSIAKLRKDWNDANYFLSKETAQGFAKASEKAAAVQASLTEIKRAYEYCGTPSQQYTPQTQKAPDYSLWFALALVVLLAIAAYAYYRKKQEEFQEFGGQQ